ncbi:MAG: methyltransferase domain-containing protein [Caldicoprobacterales bacterium]
MIDKEQFGKRISVLRKKIGLSQAELAEKFNVSPQAVSKWETGLTLPDIDILLEMSWFFDISINALLEDNNKFTNSNVVTRAKLPEQVNTILKSQNEKQLLASLVPYFNDQELIELARRIANGSLRIHLDIEASDSKAEYEKKISIPVQSLSETCLRELSPATSESVSELVGSIDRGLKRVSEIMICPICKEKLEIYNDNSGRDIWFECKNTHRFNVEDGVVYFGTREILGELWSLYLRNYEHYLKEQTQPILPVYNRGKVYSQEVKWREIERVRPRIIVDIACGTGSGIKYIMQRINWNCIVILCDLSHRILKWNRKYFTENMNNPYVDIVYLACDCANMPIQDNSVDCVTSTGGFESMQYKMMEGFKEAYRILKSGANAIYNMALIDDRNSLNTQKWIQLLHTIIEDKDNYIYEMMIDIAEWEQKCIDTGYKHTKSIKIYGELPAPDTDVFPFENMIMRWMADYICVSHK